jgi:acid stress chaperone HdeB
MYQKLVVYILTSSLCLTSFAQAQVTIDASKITCDQYVHSKISIPNYIAAWLSGYYHAMHNNRLIDVQKLQENVNKLELFCKNETNFKMPVMKAAEQLLGAGG